jgi:hypothetical protein
MTDVPTLIGPIDVWAAGAVPGSRVIYHTGTHAHGSVCRQAMDLFDAGVLTLVRKRADKPHEFHYIAEKLGGKHGRKR